MSWQILPEFIKLPFPHLKGGAVSLCRDPGKIEELVRFITEGKITLMPDYIVADIYEAVGWLVDPSHQKGRHS